jgi:hypothetical protein
MCVLERCVLALGRFMEACIETLEWSYRKGIFAFGEGCRSIGHFYGSMYRYSEMGIQKGAFWRTTYVRLGKGFFHWAYLWKHL